jgi:aminotransferase
VELALRRGVLARYSLSPGLPELRELIEIDLAKSNMYYDWQEEILVTVGTIEAITATIMAVANPGDEIIIPEPTYTSYREVITLAGCKTVPVPLDESRGWAFDINKFESAITPKTKAIFFCNPNNPTGTIYSREEQMRLAELAERHDLFILTDEVYKEFLFDDKRIFSLAEVPKLRKRVIRMYGFSKAYAMTGWRIGYLHSDASVVKEIIKVHDSLVTCAPVISQYGAMGALEMGESDVLKFNNEYRERRDLICKRLDCLSHVFGYVFPQSTYYVFPQIKNNYLPKSIDNIYNSKSWEFSMELLRKCQVATVPGFAFGPSGENHIRFSFGKDQDDINKAFDRLDKYFE